MNFRIADTFTDSLARLTGNEQKAVKTTAFDLQLNPAQPGLQFHKLDRTRDRNFWSVRVSRDVRIIVHRTRNSLLLCYVDHHDNAYQWAERRKLETHPRTGAAQLVEVREIVQEIAVPQYVATQPLLPPPSPLYLLMSQRAICWAMVFPLSGWMIYAMLMKRAYSNWLGICRVRRVRRYLS